MPLRQQFSTTVYSWNGEMSAEVTFLPRADMAVSEKNDDIYVRVVAHALGPYVPVRAYNLERGLAAFLEMASRRRLKTLESRWRAELDVPRRLASPRITIDNPEFLRSSKVLLTEKHLDFAKELLSSSRIPIEESPLTGIPLGEVFSRASKASSTGLGALIGWIIAGNTPLLLLWVPVGIILVRSAVGVGRGLEEGLHAKIKKLFTPVRVRQPEKAKLRMEAHQERNS